MKRHTLGSSDNMDPGWANSVMDDFKRMFSLNQKKEHYTGVISLEALNMARKDINNGTAVNKDVMALAAIYQSIMDGKAVFTIAQGDDGKVKFECGYFSKDVKS